LERLKRDLSATRLGKTTPVRLATAVAQEMGDDDATHMAASVSYYAILSLFPLVLGLSAIVGVVANSPERQEEVIEFIIEYLPGSEAFVRESVEGVVKLRAAFGIGSVLSLLWTGSAVFGSITRAVNRAWDVHKDLPFYKNKPRQLGMALGISLLFLISLSITTAFQWATSIDIGGGSLSSVLGGGVISGLLKIPALLVSFAIFATVYKVLPNTKTYWRYIWVGAVVAAGLFEGGKNLFLWYLENFAQYDQLYGNIASVIVLMVWTYFSALILILGAEIASEYGRLKVGVGRGQTIHKQS
jgi:membrane protein